MKARQLIDGASFGPDALKAIGAAFDAAWAEIANDFRTDPVKSRPLASGLQAQCCQLPSKTAATCKS